LKNITLITLTPPKLSTEHIQQKISCIRGHRERIFQVFAEEHSGKKIFHNYGQGGAGLTFLFGCVEESIKQFEKYCSAKNISKNNPICVIGAGCYGLLTACTLAYKGYNVKIVAKQTENLPSHNGAGFFFPRHRRSSTPEEIKEYQLHSMASFIAYQKVINGQHPFIARGPCLLPAYYDLSINPGLEPFIKKGLLPEPKKVRITFGGSTIHEVMHYQILFINAHQLMEELETARKNFNIPIEQRTIQSFDELEEAIIFNCAGLGARQLANDNLVNPVQGHLIALYNQPKPEELNYLLNVKAPVDHARGIEPHKLIYFTPKGQGLLGITFLRGKKALQTNEHEFEKMLTRAQAFFGY
jgi:hypothetical protein